jgi:aspartyl-tRNA(Asn)/glutamyl-tRNA(Gln) amidotransferase subunit C
MLTEAEVLKIAHLARLDLTPEEVKLYQQRLGRVLDYVKELEQLNTSNISLVSHVPADASGLREDKPVPFSDPGSLLKNAPESQDQQFLLPAVLE